MRTIAYLLAGLLISLGLAAAGAAHLDPLRDHALLGELCDISLIIAVFGSGLAVERRVRRSSWRLIALLLVVVMPATIAAVAAFGAFVMGLPLAAAVLLGAVLAPSDPVLAGDVGLGPPGEPELGEPRLSLHTEAGANDGLASPFVAAGLALAHAGGVGWVGHWLAVDVALRAGIALLIGVVAGRLGVLAAVWLRRRGLDGGGPLHGRGSQAAVGLLTLALPFAIYGVCEPLHAYGLVAAFAAGFAFRRGEPDEALHITVHEVSERAGRVLELVVIVTVGSLLTLTGLAAPGIGGWLLAPVLILVVRPPLVLAVTPGSTLNRSDRWYLGFFGVRGVAAVYYAVLLAGTHALSVHDTRVVVWTTLVCVAVSIVVHGIGAIPHVRTPAPATDP